jgi:membrane-bound metal-dependent hydrolase YbcI (DUF457 family)
MMGRTHGISGWCAGLAVAPALGLATLPSILFATTVAGFALLPDLDCGSATASRILGPITGAMSWALRGASRALYAVTKGPRDEDWSGEHRHLSHTVVFALAAGGLTALGTHLAGRWVVLAVLAFGILLAHAALGGWIALAAGGGAAAIAITSGGTVLDSVAPWLWIAVTVGCVVHCLGDALTLSGCPFLFPIPIAGETWAELGPPYFMRFRTGGAVESRVIFPVFAALGVLLLPGVWDTALTVIHHIAT